MPEGEAERLIIAFNFPPFTDGSAVTVAKRIVEAEQPVDVVAADLRTVRTTDPSLLDIVTPWINRHHTLSVPILFTDERSTNAFSAGCLRAVRTGRRASYPEVYSRSMWPHSHLAAAHVHVSGRAHRWSAEFSDPLLWHVDATPRVSGPLSLNPANRRILHRLGAREQQFLTEHMTVLAWSQFVPFMLADELVFTNTQQLEVMLADAPDWLRIRVEDRAVVAPHPTLPRRYYTMGQQARSSAPGTEQGENDLFRIGYFGTFYPNRGGGEFLEALSLLSEDDRKRVRLDVYTGNAGRLLDVASRLGVSANVRRRHPLPLLEFLNTSDSYDALLVNDIATSPFAIPSPFLPSKYSDYAGSSAETMAITLPGSPLDKAPAQWRAHIGDVEGIARMLTYAVSAQ